MHVIPHNANARVVIDRDTLARLLGSRQLHVCELTCLDTQSKQLLRKLCLETCLQACDSKKGRID